MRRYLCLWCVLCVMKCFSTTKKCWRLPCFSSSTTTTTSSSKQNRVHINPPPRVAETFEEKMNHLISTSTAHDRIHFIDKCRFAGIIPGVMAHHMQCLLLDTTTTTTMPQLEKLHTLLCREIKAENIQNVAESYRFNAQTYAKLESNCAKFGLNIADVVGYFAANGDQALSDAVRLRRDCCSPTSRPIGVLE